VALQRSVEIKVGLFILLCLAIIAGLIIKFGKLERFNEETYDIAVVFPNVGGIVRNASVMYDGIPIGRVHDIKLTGEGAMKVRLILAIYKGYTIRQDARFMINQSGLLGDRYVDVVPESATAEPLSPGSEIQGTNTVDLTEAIQNVVDVLQEAAGTIGRVDGLVRRTDLAIKRVDELLLTTQNLNSVGTTLAHIDTTASNAAVLTADLGGTMSSTRMSLSNTLERFSMAADDINDAAKRVRGLVVSNQDDISATASNLAQSTARLNALLEGLQKGDGTAGKLLTDPTLHDEIVKLVHNWRQYGILYKDKTANSATTDNPRGKTPIPDRPAAGYGTNSGASP
jgi:phospholipid/cholesterol/gamma-HCH transport system substrate-binding protein